MFKKNILFVLALTMMLYSQGNFRTDILPQKVLTDTNEYFMNPKWSPDGSMIAFSGSNYNGLWVMNLISKNLKNLSDEQGVGFGFSWSNDGNSILVRATKTIDRKTVNAIKLLDVNSGSESLLTAYNQRINSVPTWSGDNSKVMFKQYGSIQSINTGKLAKPSGSFTDCFLESGKIKVLTSNNEKLILDPVPGSDYLNLQLSPNKEYLSFEVMGGNLYTMHVNGSKLTDLGSGYRAQWSPDNQYLVYMISEDDGHDYIASEIYIVQREGRLKWQLTASDDRIEMNPSWSPDGNKIAYNDYTNGTIYIQNLSE